MLRCLKLNTSHLQRCISSSSTPKLVIFDKDGTLQSFEKPWLAWCNRLQNRLVEHTAAKVGGSIKSKLSDMGVDMKSGQIGLGTFAENSQADVRDELRKSFQATLLELSQDKYLADKIFDSCRELEDGKHTLTDVYKLFVALRDAGYKIAIATADTTDGVSLFLATNNATRLVEFTMCSGDRDFAPKPSKTSALKLCKVLGVEPSNVVMVGDTPTDIQFGLNGGFGMVVGVTSGIGTADDLLSAGAHHIIDNVGDLPALLKVPNQDNSTPTQSPYHLTSTPKLSRSYSTGCTRGGTVVLMWCRDRESGFTHQPFHPRHATTPLSPKVTPFSPGHHPHSRAMSTAANRYASETKHDYVIVGAGSAGCVIANRLSEDGKDRVLSLEAGPKDTWLGSRRLMWKIHMPSALMYNLCDDKYNWYYQTTPQVHLNNRIMYWPRGRVWGGSSSLNAMVYIRGNALDYDRWEDEGAKDWSYAHCLPYFKKSTKHSLGENDYRGGEGPIGVTRHSMDNPLYEAFVKAGQEAGYPYTEDMNGYQQEGFGPMDSTTWKGMRSSAAVAHLHKQMKTRANLNGETGCLVTKVVVEGGKARGVEYRQGGQLKYAAAEKSVILSGGAVNSPQLLMLSGIGPAKHLASHGIPVEVNLPGVGQGMQDHLEVYVQDECLKPITLYKWQQPHNMVRIGLRWFYDQTGLCGSAHMEVGGFIRSRAGIPSPDIQFHFLPAEVVDQGRGRVQHEAYQVHVGQMRQESRGYLELQSADPAQHPIIEPNYLSTTNDVWEMRACVKLTREIFAQKAFEEYRKREIMPGPEYQSDEDIDRFVREKGSSAYHPSSTCKMGVDEMAVVSPETLKVYGLDNLRVIDASIMPSVVSGNLNGPTLMLAEKCADIVRGKTPLAPAWDVPVYRPATLETQR